MTEACNRSSDRFRQAVQPEQEGASIRSRSNRRRRPAEKVKQSRSRGRKVIAEKGEHSRK
jgi:hypothetical protein